ncbi:MAG TPA: DUF1003 domain-containing protein [Gemmatimonas sp.]|nr:DUF1003 domain-containing protein [Gemmatimonas sp.]
MAIPDGPPARTDAESAASTSTVTGPAADAAVAAAVDAVLAAARVPEHVLTPEEWDHLSRRDQRLLKAIFERIARRETVSRNANAELEESRTVGERIADRIADFGGSWTFILMFVGFLALWAIVNTIVLTRERAPDPFPFIFLNLLLSMVAALQAPVIMMSQKRQAQRDRLAAENDYQVNLRAEVEIRELHDKLDALREGQWRQLVAQQEEQIKLLSVLCDPAFVAPAKATAPTTAERAPR